MLKIEQKNNPKLSQKNTKIGPTILSKFSKNIANIEPKIASKLGQTWGQQLNQNLANNLLKNKPKLNQNLTKIGPINRPKLI